MDEPQPTHRRSSRRAARRDAGPPDTPVRTEATGPPGLDQPTQPAQPPQPTQKPGPPSAVNAPSADWPPETRPLEARPRDEQRAQRSDRALRQLAGNRATQLPPVVAMRAREVGRPSAADIAAAEAELVIVRRYYVPPGEPAADTPDTRRARSSATGARGSRRTRRDRQDGTTGATGSAS